MVLNVLPLVIKEVQLAGRNAAEERGFGRKPGGRRRVIIGFNTANAVMSVEKPKIQDRVYLSGPIPSFTLQLKFK